MGYLILNCDEMVTISCIFRNTGQDTVYFVVEQRITIEYFTINIFIGLAYNNIIAIGVSNVFNAAAYCVKKMHQFWQNNSNCISFIMP